MVKPMGLLEAMWGYEAAARSPRMHGGPGAAWGCLGPPGATKLLKSLGLPGATWDYLVLQPRWRREIPVLFLGGGEISWNRGWGYLQPLGPPETTKRRREIWEYQATKAAVASWGFMGNLGHQENPGIQSQSHCKPNKRHPGASAVRVKKEYPHA